MSRVFPKLGKVITMAAKEGGEDPESNSKLRTAIMNAKAQNMPKDKIEAAIKRASGKDAQSIVEVSYEGKGPHGVLLFVECATDNTNRSVSNVKTYFNKAGGEVVNSGAFDFLFSRKAVIEIEITEGLDLDEVELELIDAGLEEFEVDEHSATAYGNYTSFGSLTRAAETLGVTIKNASLQRVPNSPIEFPEEQLEEIEALIDQLEEDEDVQAVYNNIA
jgi:YebC/PmpR family DNA-binding regulatory protein